MIAGRALSIGQWRAVLLALKSVADTDIDDLCPNLSSSNGRHLRNSFKMLVPAVKH